LESGALPSWQSDKLADHDEYRLLNASKEARPLLTREPRLPQGELGNHRLCDTV